MKKYNDKDIIQAVKNNQTIKDVLVALHLAPTGGNYKTIHRAVKRLKLNTSHWNSKNPSVIARQKEKVQQPIEKFLTTNSTYSRSRIKRRIIEEKLLKYECAICGISTWLNEPLSLHLDHINGIRNDNRLENLRFLCPNCHSLTPTYCGKANKKPDKLCVDCGKKIWKTSTRCVECARKHHKPKEPTKKTRPTKIDWPPLEQLCQMLEHNSYVAVGRALGVSDNAIRKHIKKHS